MNKIVAIVLVGLLGFLGCSGDDNDTNTIGEANLVAPFGIIETPTPTYKWTPVSWATKYRLVVQDTNQASTVQDTNEISILDEWYTAEESGCASEDGLCEATPDAEVIGKNEFKVQACENENCGLWSEPMSFDFTAINKPRFTDNGDGTVTDNYTYIIWAKQMARVDSAGRPMQLSYTQAVDYCKGLKTGGYTDWKLPSLSELDNVIFADDPGERDICGPPSPPFFNPGSVFTWYWSNTLQNRYIRCKNYWAVIRDGPLGMCGYQAMWNSYPPNDYRFCGGRRASAGAWCMRVNP